MGSAGIMWGYQMGDNGSLGVIGGAGELVAVAVAVY